MLATSYMKRPLGVGESLDVFSIHWGGRIAKRVGALTGLRVSAWEETMGLVSYYMTNAATSSDSGRGINGADLRLSFFSCPQ